MYGVQEEKQGVVRFNSQASGPSRSVVVYYLFNTNGKIGSRRSVACLSPPLLNPSTPGDGGALLRVLSVLIVVGGSRRSRSQSPRENSTVWTTTHN